MCYTRISRLPKRICDIVTASRGSQLLTPILYPDSGREHIREGHLHGGIHRVGRLCTLIINIRTSLHTQLRILRRGGTRLRARPHCN